ncbi:branched-chain amino acid aminotransferase [bacterium]|jgi:branched-chain amino acid aminotransferase|nr:branched chain amino acid aminotransferase [Gemmatimonadota bacterium]MCH2665339.1 branched-chain amino acid aminotransferase [bacterium]HCK12355.1 branched chain amino acid aminotransferase [Candidatus Latescibacterota bacterium]
MDIQVTLADKGAREKIPDVSTVEFGKQTTDHMFRMSYTQESSWHDARILPYEPLSLDPTALVLHYNQQIFEGLKAFRQPDGSVSLFRPGHYGKRFRNSATRMAMPVFDPEQFVESIQALVATDDRWVPNEPNTSLYIRPTMIATEPGLGVRASNTYLYYVIACPVAAYYKEGAKPTRIAVEEGSVRAAPGGVGEAKTSGNYAPSLKATKEAVDKGFSQVLWLDAKEKRFVEEVGTSNIFFKFGEELVTPSLSGTILPGVTRDSVLRLANEWGIKTVERKVSIDEVIDGCQSGQLTEVFATGTAAVVSPIGELSYRADNVQVQEGETGDLSKRLYEEITAVQYGQKADELGWMVGVR